MNDKDITKALRCCAQPIPICRERPCYDLHVPYPCADQLKWAALNLIDNQQAEIERLQKYNTEVAYKHYNDGIKGFAERLKAKSHPFPCAIGVEYAVTIRAINDLVKEMVGDTE